MTENLLLREVDSVDVAPGVYQAKWIKGNANWIPVSRDKDWWQD